MATATGSNAINEEREIKKIMRLWYMTGAISIDCIVLIILLIVYLFITNMP